MEKNENTSSLQTLVFVLRRRIVIILAISVLTALLFGAVTVFFIDPVYSSRAKFYVNNTQDQMTSVSQQDLSASKSLAESSIVIIKNSNDLLKAVIKEANTKAKIDITPKELKNMINAGTYSGTEAFYISVSSTDPEQAHILAKAFDVTVPKMIPSMIKKGDVSVIDTPEVPKEPDSPNVVLYTVIGAFMGFAASFVIFYLAEALDNTIYTEEDIKDKFGYPIIGVIPTIVTPEQSAKPSNLIGFIRERGKNK
ncbi:MAG: hypothetical protein IKL24_06085 [Clostridia bacterium]|nr:hypothetical protein [Clostridia bacterium]